MTKKKEKYDLVAERCREKNTRLKVEIPGLPATPGSTPVAGGFPPGQFGLSESIGCSTHLVQPSCTEYSEKLLKQKSKVNTLGARGLPWHARVLRETVQSTTRKFTGEA